MPLEAQIKELLARPSHELQGPYAEELEDTVQRGLAAVHSAELWVRRLRDSLVQAAADDDRDRVAALGRELTAAQTAVHDARAQVSVLHERAQRLGVGAPRT